MVRFYRDVVARLPRVIWESIKHSEGILAIIFFAVLLVNEPLGRRLLGWEGIDPLWSFLPLGALFAYGVMRAIYDEYAIVRDRLVTQLSGASKGQIRFAGFTAVCAVTSSRIIDAPEQPGMLRLELKLENVGNDLLSYTMSRLVIEMPELSKISVQGPFQPSFMYPGTEALFVSEWIPDIDFHVLSNLQFKTTYEIHYDTDPPTRQRISVKEIRMHAPSPGASGRGTWLFTKEREE